MAVAYCVSLSETVCFPLSEKVVCLSSGGMFVWLCPFLSLVCLNHYIGLKLDILNHVH